MHSYGFAAMSKENHAAAVGYGLPVSTKAAVEVCSLVRGKNVLKAIETLMRVADMKTAVPFRRYKKGGIGHRPGIGVGRYPIKTATAIRKIIESAASNAEQKGMNKSSLKIIHIAAHRGAKMRHSGRQRGQLMKRTIVEVIVGEK
jgi:large subunit ribosomal protein L22